MARRYDVNSDSILFVNNQPYSRDSYSLAGMGDTVDDLLHFCRTMYSMKVDNAEYALLTAIVIFSGEYQVEQKHSRPFLEPTQGIFGPWIKLEVD